MPPSSRCLGPSHIHRCILVSLSPLPLFSSTVAEKFYLCKKGIQLTGMITMKNVLEGFCDHGAGAEWACCHPVQEIIVCRDDAPYLLACPYLEHSRTVGRVLCTICQSTRLNWVLERRPVTVNSSRARWPCAWYQQMWRPVSDINFSLPARMQIDSSGNFCCHSRLLVSRLKSALFAPKSTTQLSCALRRRFSNFVWSS